MWQSDKTPWFAFTPLFQVPCMYCFPRSITSAALGVYVENEQEVAMLERLRPYMSFENEAFVIAALAFLFCGAVILGLM